MNGQEIKILPFFIDCIHMLKKMFRFLLCCLAILMVFVLIGYFSFSRTLPQAHGSLEVPGLQATVEIDRDQWGIPHIYAQNEHDLYFAAGYVCAQDRAGQMELLRRVATGHSAEKLGADLLPIDVLARTINPYTLRREVFSTLSQAAQSQLTAYANGVNAFFSTAAALPLEFGFVFDQPEPWQGEDSIAIVRLMAWLLSMGWHADLFYGEMARKLPAEKLELLLPTSHGKEDFIAQEVCYEPYASLFAEAEAALERVLHYHPQCLGSNAVVISSKRTQNSGALLANDTHLPFTAPSIYYIMHLQAPHLNAVGVCIPGIPGLVLGRNEHIAWGITNAMTDDVDFFHVVPDSSDSHYVCLGSQRLPVTIADELIRVRHGKPYTLRTRWTPVGPLIGAEQTLLDAPQMSLLLRWTAFMADDPFTAFHNLLTASNWEEFTQALSTHKNPGENLFYADDRGHIGYQLAAAIPLRNYATPMLPVASDGQWLGLLPYEQLPRLFDPSEGYIANANQDIPGKDSQVYYSAYWEPDYRYHRMQALLDTVTHASVDFCQSLQSDVYSAHAGFFVPQLLSALGSYKAVPDSPAAYGMALLQMWDYNQKPESIAASLYERTFLELMRLTFEDEMGATWYRRFLELPHTNIRALDRLLAMNDSLWFDDVRTADKRETVQELLQRAYLAAVDSMTALFSDNIGLWTWGDLHPVTFPHIFGSHKPFCHFFNIGPFEIGGGNFTLNNATYALSRPFAARIGPCLRQICDLSTQQYQVIITTGQSGHPFSPHYADMTPLWLKGERITLDLTDDAPKSDRKRLTLKPSQRK